MPNCDHSSDASSATWRRLPLSVVETNRSIEATSSRPATPMISISPSNVFCTSTTAGASPMHVGHHGAQNHNTRSWPSRSPSSIWEPSTSAYSPETGHSPSAEAALLDPESPLAHAAASSARPQIRAIRRGARATMFGTLDGFPSLVVATLGESFSVYEHSKVDPYVLALWLGHLVGWGLSVLRNHHLTGL